MAYEDVRFARQLLIEVSVRKQRIYTQKMKKQKTKKQIMEKQIMKKRLDEYAVGSADNDEDATKMTIVVAIIAMMK